MFAKYLSIFFYVFFSVSLNAQTNEEVERYKKEQQQKLDEYKKKKNQEIKAYKKKITRRNREIKKRVFKV